MLLKEEQLVMIHMYIVSTYSFNSTKKVSAQNARQIQYFSGKKNIWAPIEIQILIMWHGKIIEFYFLGQACD